MGQDIERGSARSASPPPAPSSPVDKPAQELVEESGLVTLTEEDVCFDLISSPSARDRVG